jgi:iron complex outermembrane recepter protein
VGQEQGINMNSIGRSCSYASPVSRAASSCLLLLVGSAANAQQAPAGSVLEEITVTAQKRSQNLQDVGLSITAFSGEQLEQLGIASTIDIAAQVPSLQYQSFSPSFTVFNIRGVSQNNFADNLEAPVAVYVDGAYVATLNGIGGQLFDTERVEVLRGPQGTLFGRNATGGLLHFISKAPSRTPDGYVEASVSEFNSYSLEGAAGGALSERIAGRFSARWEKSDGYLENVYPGARDGRGKDGYAMRGQLLFDASEDFTALVKAFYSEDDDVPDGYYVSAAADQDPQTGLGIIAVEPGNVHQTNSNFKGYLDRKTYGATVTLTKQLGADTELVSISNYLDNDKSYGEDSDISPDDFFIFLTRSKHEQWSQELRLSGATDASRWQVGVYYLDITSDDGAFNGGSDPVNIVSVQPHNPGFDAGPGCPLNPPGLDLNCGPLGHTETDFLLNSRNYSAFGQVEYDLNDTWIAILGYRWTHDDKDFNYHLVEYNSGGAVGEEVAYNRGTTPQAEISWSDWAGRAQLNWRPMDGTLFFLSWNRGVKGGNWTAPTFVVDAQASIAEGILRHDEEVLQAVELGAKLDFLDDRARLNAAVFYYDYDNYQSFSLTNFVQSVVNRDATVAGGEIELTLRPASGWDVLLGVSLLDSKVRDVPTTGLIGATLTPTPVIAVDADLPNAPSYSFNGLVRYEWPAFGGALSAQVDFRYNDRQSLEATNAPGTNEDAYFLGNLDLTFRPGGNDNWRWSAWVRNVTDTEYRIYALDTSFVGNIQNVYGAPRTFGVTMAYHW